MAGKEHFRIAGIPVRVEPVFWITTVFLAFNLDDARLIVIWVAVVPVSILVHELGHALSLKAFGQSSSIVLHGFGGVTLSQRRLTRGRSIVVSLAGSVTALALLGIPAMLVRDSDFGLEIYLDWLTGGGGFGWWPVLYFLVYVNIWWSIANLLPIRPLDGGNVMTELVGIQRARLVSMVVGAAAAVWAWFFAEPGFEFAALFAGFLAVINFAEYRRSSQGAAGPSTFDVDAPGPSSVPPSRPRRDRGRAPRRGGRPSAPPSASPPTVSALPGTVDPAAAESMAWNLLRRGEAAAARRVLQRSTGPVGPFVAPSIECAAGGGVDGLVDAYLANPGGPSNLVPASVAADAGQAVVLARRLSERGPKGLEALGNLQTHLHYAERFDHAAAVGEIAFASADGTKPQIAFDAACSWSRAGDLDRALDWVRRAVDAGFRAPSLLDGEPDLASVRAHPGWAEVRAQV